MKWYKNQKQSFDFFKDKKRTLDFSDPGTGKTRVAIELVAYRKSKNKTNKSALVLAPKSLLEPAWEDDVKKFAPFLTTSVAYASNREKAFAAPADLYITNTDAVKWIVKQPRHFFSKFDTLIIDEIPAFKHRGSQRSKAALKIKDFFEYRHGMTGTPNTAGITDLWHQAMLIDDGERLGKSFFHFRNTTQYGVQVGPRPEHKKWIDKDGIELAIASLLEDITMRHDFDECFDVPNTISIVSYTMPAKQERAYDELADYAATILESGNEVDAVNRAVLRQKLLQVASGAVYSRQDSDSSYSLVDDSRYDLVIELIDDRVHPSLVFFQWKHQRDELVKKSIAKDIPFVVLDGSVSSGSERKQIVDDFQSGKYKAMFLHPKTGAHGLTLTKARTIIWPSPTSDAEWWKQAIHRIVRSTQKHKTETILIQAKKTFEEKIYQSQIDKTYKMDNFLDYFQESRQ